MVDIRTAGIARLAAIMLGTVAVVGFASEASARGAFPEISSPGKCTRSDGTIDPNVTTRGVLRKSQDVWSFSLETIGANSVGTWSLDFAKNGVPQGSSMNTFPPPGGWSVAGAAVNKGEKGTFTFDATSTNVSASDPGAGDVCAVTMSIKI